MAAQLKSPWRTVRRWTRRNPDGVRVAVIGLGIIIVSWLIFGALTG